MGYDFPLRTSGILGKMGFILLGTGGVVFAISMVYYSYGFIAKSNIDDLNYVLERPLPQEVKFSADRSADTLAAESNLANSANSPEDSRLSTSRNYSSDEVSLNPRLDTIVNVDISQIDIEREDLTKEHIPDPGNVSNDINGVQSRPKEYASNVPLAEYTQEILSQKAQVSQYFGDAEKEDSIIDGNISSLSQDSALEDVTDLSGKRTHLTVLEGTSAKATLQPLLEELQAEIQLNTTSTSIEFTDKIFPATEIRIPSIGVDAAVEDLELLTIADSYVWETPDNIVGHIPTSAYPASLGQGWYFGHLESPVLGEGNVFNKLSEIPRLLREEEKVYVFLQTSLGEYIYQVYKSEYVHENDLLITDSGKMDITLVTCYPKLVYDHRLLVTAALVDMQALDHTLEMVD